MADTQIITLTKTPVQITNGTNSAFIQSASTREFSFAHSASSPNTALGAHTSRELFVAPPFSIWIWSAVEEPIRVSVSVA